jgi:hypothetical protein
MSRFVSSQLPVAAAMSASGTPFIRSACAVRFALAVPVVARARHQRTDRRATKIG